MLKVKKCLGDGTLKKHWHFSENLPWSFMLRIHVYVPFCDDIMMSVQWWYLFSGLVTVVSLSSVKTELRARCNLWKEKHTHSQRLWRLWISWCSHAEGLTWLVCSQYRNRGSFTLKTISLYTMCSAIVVSRDKATPTQSITKSPEKCLIPICNVWLDRKLEKETRYRQEVREADRTQTGR